MILIHPALDGATNSCPFTLVSCHQTMLWSRGGVKKSVVSHHTPYSCQSSCWLSRALIHTPCQLEFSSSPSSMQHLHAQWEWLSTGALRESRCVCVCVGATRPRRGQKTTKYTMSTGKNAPATEKWVVDGLLMFILKVLHQCCALSCFCYSA